MINLVAAMLPYLAVLVGIYVLHSAWWTIGLYHAGIIAFILWRKPDALLVHLRTGCSKIALVMGLLGCALAAPVVYFLWPWFAISGDILPKWLAQYGLTGLAWALLIPYFSIVHPAMEEVYWRTISPAGFRRLCLHDLLFAGYHVLVLFQLIRWPWLILVFIVLAGSSVCWRWMAGRFEGYAMPVLSHAVADTAVIVAVVLLLNR